MSRFARQLFIAAIAGALLAGSAQAQLLGGGGIGVPSLALPVPTANLPVAGPVLQNILNSPQAQQAVRPTLDTVSGLPEQIAQSGPGSLLELRRLRMQELIRNNRGQLEPGDGGVPVRRGVLVVLDPDAAGLQRALQAGFRLAANDANLQLGFRVVQLAVPAGMSARAGLKLLQRVAPQLQADFDPLFEPAGTSLAPIAAALASSGASASGRAIGMIDGGVAAHPSLAGKSIEQNGFAGPPKPTGHGTAVASLLVGSQGQFRGAATGAQLFVADVYGGNQAAGSATAIVKALGWLASHRPQVINISLVGPSNRLVQRAVLVVQSSPQSATTAPPRRRNIPLPIPAWSRSPASTRMGARWSRPVEPPTSTSRRPAPTWPPRSPARVTQRSAERASLHRSRQPACCLQGRRRGSLRKLARARARSAAG